MDRQLLDAAVHARSLDPGQLEDGRRDVDGVVELRADPSAVADAVGPLDDERVAHPAAVGVALVALERRVGDLGPTPRVGRVHGGTTDGVQLLDALVDVARLQVEDAAEVEQPGGAALLAGPVVGEQHDDGVVEHVGFPQELDDPTELLVGVLDHRGVRLLETGGEAALVIGELVPGGHTRVPRRQVGRRRHDAELLLAGEALGADDVPAAIEAAPLTFEMAGGCLQGPVGGAEGEVVEERLVGSEREVVGQHGDRLVDQVVTEVVAVLGPGGRFDQRVVAHQLREELVGEATEESVEPLEALAQGPVLERTDLGLLVGRRQVPLAHRVGRVAGVAQELGQRGRRRGDAAAGVGEAGVPLGDDGHAHAVVVAAGEQRGAGRRAQRGRVELVVAEAPGGEPVDGGGVELGSVGAEVGEADVVEHHEQHVGGALAGPRRLRPRRCGVRDRPADGTGGGRSGRIGGGIGHRISLSHHVDVLIEIRNS